MIADPYKVLEVSRDATEEEIAKAYRRLAKMYHPDVNHGHEDAARKMSEINAAYEQIKSGKVFQENGGGFASQGAGTNAGTSHEEDDPFGFGFNPFNGFDAFGGGFGQYGGSRQQSRAFSEFDPVRNYLRAGYYAEASNALNDIADKSAEWYYYSAIINSNTGNKITALQHAKIAVQMDPANPEYQRVLDNIQNGGRVYQQQSQNYGMPTGNLNRICWGVLIANLFCMFCGRPFF